MISDFFRNKENLILLILVFLSSPVWRGGRELLYWPIALALAFLAVYLALRLPKARAIRANLLTWSFLGLFGWSLLSLIWSVNRYETVLWNLQLLLALGAFLAAYQLQLRKGLLEKWADGAILVAGLFSAIGLWMYLTNSYERLTSTLYLPNPFAAYLLVLSILGFWRADKRQSRWLLAAATLNSTALLLTFSRTSLALFTVALILMAINSSRQQLKKILPITGAAVLLAVSASIYHDQKFETPSQVQNRFIGATEDIQTETSGSDRLFYLRSTLDIAQDHWLLGSGGGTFSVMHPQYQHRVISASSHAHNAYLQVLAELGLPGFLLVIGFVAGALQLVARAWKDGNHYLALGAGALLAHFAVEVDSGYPFLVILAAAVLALLSVPQKKFIPQKRQRIMLALLLIAILPAMSVFESGTKLMLGEVNQNAGNFRGSIGLYERARRYPVFDPDVFQGEAVSYLKLAYLKQNQTENIDKAIVLTERAIARDPRDSEHHFLLGQALRLRGDLDGAEHAFQEALRLDPYNHPVYYSALAFHHLTAGEPERAHEVASRGVALYTGEVLDNRHFIPGFRFEALQVYEAKYLTLLELGRTDEANELSHQITELQKSLTPPAE